jgi:hypothetical protein
MDIRQAGGASILFLLGKNKIVRRSALKNFSSKARK